MIALSPKLAIDSDRLDRRIAKLARIGNLANGGVCRLAFSEEDIQARQLVRTWMQEAGMSVRNDAAGNMIGTYAGTEALASLATGSHIDTVPVGGRYDGCLGVLAGIEVARVLQENQMRLRHNFEVIVFSDEENSVIGCKAIAGNAPTDPEKYRRKDGTSIQTCLERVGGDWEKLHTAQRDRHDIAAFIELHVEQGGVLESLDKAIGVVTGIVGQYRFKVTILGRPNHAGTTPMSMRKDALLAASQLIIAINRLATETEGEQVATVGNLTVLPNATNVVPAHVEMSIDLRDLSEENLQYLIARIEKEAEAIAQHTGTEIAIAQKLHILPTPAHPPIMEAIAISCQELKLSYTYLPSRAGHDAQEIGRFTNMGMIFVPSRAGISHSQDEYTSPEQCAQGANVLLRTLLAIDRSYK
ncbi:MULTISPECIES: Zn-dependent hydrolase [Pseudanabaena]|uniref:Amidase, hydantoinase/carbamoylase family n=2 Tax=Pseudanabaena TaxID=1152 RepID=L8N2D8_9CYAN|nr:MULTISPECIES: Zn-dependent hydrolase [Pseudanabaena]ELS32905.1 amidase, hydantoinase/carbamoylase family [Pseudanabaena biceps PCC 7429]MDG3494874.1 Zn-dependent hydrolase [Pseudanabaena catenata USMAC16]